jgi:hypothetical protein
MMSSLSLQPTLPPSFFPDAAAASSGDKLTRGVTLFVAAPAANMLPFDYFDDLIMAMTMVMVFRYS